jgi:aspartate aminotransferase
MAGMAGRIARVRGELQSALESRCPDKDWSFITKQIGMFSFTGMTPQQVSWQKRIDLLFIHSSSREGGLGF